MFLGEIRGQKLIFGARADYKNLHPNDKVFGDDNVIFKVERDTILKEKEKYKERGDIPSFCEKLKNYLTYDKSVDDKLETAYEKYMDLEAEFVKLKPTKWLILLIIGIVMETAILVVQSVFAGGFNPVIILFAFMLAMGGILLGHSLGYFFFISELRRKGQSSAEEESKIPRSIFMAIVGIILILFVAYVRGMADEGIDFEVFFLTIVLGLMVATLEGVRENTVIKREEILIYRKLELLKIATKKHCENLGVYLEGIKDKCENHIEAFENECKKIK